MTEAQTKTCQNCKADFTIEPEDFEFYGRMKVPPPTWCPDCRVVRRFLARNERALYRRKCALCGEVKILMFPENSSYTPYCFQCWWSDKWDSMAYGKAFDPSKTFFAQMDELIRAVPRPGIIKQGNTVNSEYVNRCSDSKDSYLVFGSITPQNCMYSGYANFCTDCVDCYNTAKCERCYDCTDCFGSYNLAFSAECESCSDSWFLQNCRNCQNCFGCVNLRNKQYCFFNEQFTKEEYQAKIRALGVGSSSSLENVRRKFEDHAKKFIVPWAVMHHSVNSNGNWIQNSKNVRRAFTAVDVEDGAYLFNIFQSKDVMDYSQWGSGSERIYETVNTGRQCAGLKFANECWDQLIDSEYCMNCHNSSDLFGCVGLRNKQYCILNRQYSKGEYGDLVAKIKAQMDTMPYVDDAGREYRYGEFYPPAIQPFAYNESIAQEYFPLTKAEAEKRGFRWVEPEEKTHGVTLASSDLPDHIRDTTDDILKETIECAHAGNCAHQCTKAFRILPDELAIYRKANLPLPRFCSNCRHYERLAKRNPLKLWPRQCQCGGAGSEQGTYANTSPHAHGSDHCPNGFRTSYAPGRPEIVYCEQCYLAETS